MSTRTLVTLMTAAAITATITGNISAQTTETQIIKTYDVTLCPTAPKPDAFDWDKGYWADVPSLDIDNFLTQGSDQKPTVKAKVCYTTDAIHLLYKVDDQFVKSVHTQRQDQVCQDSCVEFFAWPFADKNYVNFEINAGGTFLSKRYDIKLPTVQRLEECIPLDDKVLDTVTVKTTMPAVIADEIQTPITYYVRLSVPFTVFESVYGPMTIGKDAEWRANFFKCADKTSKPHWAAWNPIGHQLNLHQFDKFGKIRFR